MRTSPVKGGEKTLTKQEFDALFERCKARCLPSDQGQIQEKLARFTNENGQVSAQALAVFTYVETIQSVSYTHLTLPTKLEV